MTEVFKLRNGITVACDERPGTDTVVFKIAFKSGSVHESADEHGLTNLALKSCFGGTKNLGRLALAKTLNRLSVQHIESVGRSTTAFAAQAARDRAAALFALMSEILLQPSLSPAEIAKTREIVKRDIAEKDQSPEDCAMKSYLEACFAGQPLGRDPEGEETLIDSFTPAQIRERLEQLLGNTENIVITASGDISAEELRAMAEENWGALASGSAAPTSAPDAALTGGASHRPAEGKNLYVRLGFPGPDNHNDERYVYLVLAQYLGGSAVSPLFQEVREKRGLAYHIGSDHFAFEKTGLFTITATAEPQNARALAETVFQTLRGIAENGVDQKLFETIKQTCGELLRESDESVFGSAVTLGRDILDRGRAVPVEEKIENLLRVTPQQVQAACAALLTCGEFISAASGPVNGFPSHDEISAMKNAAASGLPPVAAAPYTPMPPVTAAEERDERAQDKIRETILPNGIKVITVNRPGTMHAMASVGTGSNSDPEGKDGLKHANEHMVFKQTRSFGKDEIVGILEGALGASTNAHTGREQVSYEAYLLRPQSLPVAIRALGEMALAPKYDEADFSGGQTLQPDGSAVANEGEIGAILTEIAEYDDMPDERLADLAHKTIYGDQPQGRPIAGSPETVKSISVADMERHQKTTHIPNDAVFAVIGPDDRVDHDEIVALVAADFGDLPAAPLAKPAAPVFLERAAAEEMPECAAVRFELLFEGVSAGDAGYWPLEALASFIGGGKGSRLYQRLVTDRETPLVSEVDASSASFSNYGCFSFGAVTEPQDVREVVRVMAEELRQLAANLTEEDVRDARDFLKSAMSEAFITNRSCLHTLSDFRRIREKPVCRADILDEIDATVTRDNILAAAARLQKAAVAYVAPPGTDPALLPGIDEVKEMLKNVSTRPDRKPAHDASGKRQGP